MRHELIAEVSEWMQKAANDIRSAEVDLTAEPKLLEDVAFHAQQAAEKSIKGFLTFHSRPFRKTHDIEELGTNAVKIDPALEPLIRKASVLTPFAWQFRYPGDSSEPEEEDAVSLLNISKEVYDTVLSHLPHEVRDRLSQKSTK
jgi:HEPN domain-containing protein